ncbi:intersectin-EH-binding protein Ibp1 [Mycolicibacterium smegmatis]|uniref:Intersectin-EH binding protein Ibp1 n=2 Tax=Mycolicibacterium smegmatis TaxID=1772 RepID=A0R4M5_MYCS2|nr:intersectin-EH-binding protein Ibp1 [Mycolicibacterium smegmatis]ABK73582.1 intersectin-EH binding protein Ibp1 [Mycolicibacterium smegmatis MC2 155]AIU10890.1 intersectin-EH binding protein Ibp1 [Mycolicibacterium smegmatis MC2 155]AIU17515.1 intersectin-EH binding protein Ibp1 [Mycolicibacterium smegmatis]AIU24138.1 intersectin-EH binding protein Ibp1 [Mycolicibacterium smegmatis]AWT56710.1 intersectin-EH binding protein Ibp1 [Mycolicibacterium smegmatis MKD8]
MTISQFTARRLPLAVGMACAAAAVAVAPVFSALSAPTSALAACPNGETEDTFTNQCVPDLVPNSPEPAFSTAPNQLPQIDGIPCTGANTGQCIGLGEEQQAQGPAAVPRSSVGSSPTVTGHTN